MFHVGEGGKIFTCPYPLKVQVRPPWDRRLTLLSKVSGQEDGSCGGRGGGKIFTCPYPLKVQARPPWDRRLRKEGRKYFI